MISTPTRLFFEEVIRVSVSMTIRVSITARMGAWAMIVILIVRICLSRMEVPRASSSTREPMFGVIRECFLVGSLLFRRELVCVDVVGIEVGYVAKSTLARRMRGIAMLSIQLLSRSLLFGRFSFGEVSLLLDGLRWEDIAVSTTSAGCLGDIRERKGGRDVAGGVSK